MRRSPPAQVAQVHTIRWKRLTKADAAASVHLFRPRGFPFHALNTLAFSAASYGRLGIRLFERGTESLLAPAVEGNDYRGTLTLKGEGFVREHGAAREFMFTGPSWSRPASFDGGGRRLRSVRTMDDSTRMEPVHDHDHAAGLVPPALPVPEAQQQPRGSVGRAEALRRLQGGPRRQLLGLREDQSERLFESFWPSVWESVTGGDDFDRDTPTSIVTYGTELAYVGIKVARQITLGSLLVISGHNHSTPAFHAISTLMDELSIEHALYKRQLTAEVVDELYVLPDVVHYQFLGIETFHQVANLGAAFIPYFGRLLAKARVTFLAVIPPATLKLIAALLHPNAPPGHAGVFSGMVHQALKRAGVSDFEVTLLDASETDTAAVVPRRVLRVDILSARHEVKVDCGSRRMHLEREHNEVKLVSSSGDAQEHLLHRAHAAVSLSYVLALRATSAETRSGYLKQYMDMRQQDDMCPVNVLVSDGRLAVVNLLRETPQVLLQAVHSHTFAKSSATLVNDTLQQLGGLLATPFSLMEHSSGKGNLSMGIARKFPNDTVISVEESASHAEGHWSHIKKNKGPFNNIVCNIKPGVTLMSKLLESPEVLRYQFVGLEHIVSYARKGKSGELGEILGTAFGTGVTTFLQLPSNRALSVAMATLYPRMVTKTQRRQILGPAAVPMPGLVDLEKHFVAEITRLAQQAPTLSGAKGVSVEDHKASNLSNHISVRPHLVPAVQDADGYVPSWRLLRVDVRKLEFQVNHHFDYRIDGHDRKYQMHIESNSTTEWRVYLTRRHDKWRIPYKIINSITLIALLRMGLMGDIKKRFYEQFLRMPIYEDMAPWNIVFRGGQLEYIDYDTKDNTLTKVLPFAYQIMAALMNYERTVNDFGHCTGHARNEFGLSFISHCVRSNFDGPCKESRYPVPCGDFSCRESYPGTAHGHVMRACVPLQKANASSCLVVADFAPCC